MAASVSSIKLLSSILLSYDFTLPLYMFFLRKKFYFRNKILQLNLIPKTCTIFSDTYTVSHFFFIMKKLFLVYICHSMWQFHRKPNLYKTLFQHLEQRFGKPWIRELRNIKRRIKDLILLLHVLKKWLCFDLFQCFETFKTTCYKITKTKQWHLPSIADVDQVIEDLKYFRENIETDFNHWYSIALQIATAVGEQQIAFSILLTLLAKILNHTDEEV